jgi:PAS domain S-box-containing protein
MDQKTLIELKDIIVNIDNKQILNISNLDFRSGEIHAIIGESGSGKSTIGKLLKDQLSNSSGTFSYNDQIVQNFIKLKRKPKISMVPQSLNLNQSFLAGEYIYHNKFNKHVLGFSSRKRLIKMARICFSEYNFEINPEAELQTLNLSEIAILDLLNKIDPFPDLLILDEIFSKLKSDDLQKVYQILRDFTDRGSSILFFTTKISYIYEIADRVSIIKNGEILYSNQVNSIDKINLIRLTYTDPTANQNMEELNKSFYHFLKFNEAILESLPSNIIVTNSDLEILMVNNFFKKYFQINDDKYIKRKLHDFFAESNEVFLEIIEDSSNTKTTHSFYHVPMTIDDRNTSVNLKILPITEDETIIGSIFIIEDVSELVTLQEKLILAQNLSSIGILAAGVAHEINNSLEALNNFSNLLLYDRTETEDKEIFEKISEELDFIENIVINLVSFSDKSSSNNEYINIYDATKQLIKFLEYNPQYETTKITLHNNLDNLTFVSITHNEYKQIILNLVRNSHDAFVNRGEIDITLEINEGKLRIIYEDNGPGIPEQSISSIFLPFFSTKKGAGSHLGMGLSIIYTIITKHNGNISFNNNAKKGAQFIIELQIINS